LRINFHKFSTIKPIDRLFTIEEVRKLAPSSYGFGVSRMGYIEIKKKLREEYERGYSRGFEEGKENSYERGYAEGREKGYHLGYEFGFDQGFKEGRRI